MNPFKSVLIRKPVKSKFNLTHDRKTSFKMGRIVPTLNMEVYPGETYEIRPEVMARFAPLVAPIMHDVDIDTHFFFVPNRILWDGWKDFITSPDAGRQHPYFVLPSGCDEESLGCHMGLPQYETSAAVGTRINALPFAAYLKVYDEWFRDQWLSEPQLNGGDGLDDGDNSTWINTLVTGAPLPRSWNRDYFTSGMTGSQLAVDVQIPIFSDENAIVTYNDSTGFGASDGPVVLSEDGNPIGNADVESNSSGYLQYDVSGLGTGPARIDPNGTLIVPSAQAGTIRQLRYALQLQAWFEKQAYGGGRYNETVKSHFGVDTGDARVNRPELIGNLRQKMVISEVLSTAETADAPIGQMAGHGISAKGSRKFTYTTKEHGWIIGVISVRPRTAYQQGFHRTMLRQDIFDYMHPNFQHIGDQEVPLKELYVDPTTSAELDETFCYQRRYAELMAMPSTVHGLFRAPADSGGLSYWHMGRIFENTPLFNHEFLFASSATTRIFADEEGDHIWAWIINHVHAVRPLSKYVMPATK